MLFQIFGNRVATIPQAIRPFISQGCLVIIIDVEGVFAGHLAGIVNAESDVCIFNFSASTEFWNILRKATNKDFFMFDKKRKVYTRVLFEDGYTKFQELGE